MEYGNISLFFCSLLYRHARWIYQYGHSYDAKYLEYYSEQYREWGTNRRTDESYSHRLSPLCCIYVERVGRRILCRMSYLRLAREKMMDEASQVTELCEWSM